MPIACIFCQLSPSNNHSPRQARQLSFIAEFIDEINHLSGSENFAANCFSRPSIGIRKQSQNLSGVYK